MKEFKWENLKKKAIENIKQHSFDTYHYAPYYAILQSIEDYKLGEPFSDWRENVKIHFNKASKIIENWDIRRVSYLIELFPDIIPKSYQGKTFVYFFNDKDEWIISFE